MIILSFLPYSCATLSNYIILSSILYQKTGFRHALIDWLCMLHRFLFYLMITDNKVNQRPTVFGLLTLLCGWLRNVLSPILLDVVLEMAIMKTE